MLLVAAPIALAGFMIVLGLREQPLRRRQPAEAQPAAKRLREQPLRRRQPAEAQPAAKPTPRRPIGA